MSQRSSRPSRLPDAIAGLIDSRLSGAKCSGHAPLFDNEIPNETSEHRSQRLTWAASQCRACPVQSACRTAAAEVTDAAGLWAGTIRNRPDAPPHTNGVRVTKRTPTTATEVLAFADQLDDAAEEIGQ